MPLIYNKILIKSSCAIILFAKVFWKPSKCLMLGTEKGGIMQYSSIYYKFWQYVGIEKQKNCNIGIANLRLQYIGVDFFNTSGLKTCICKILGLQGCLCNILETNYNPEHGLKILHDPRGLLSQYGFKSTWNRLQYHAMYLQHIIIRSNLAMQLQYFSIHLKPKQCNIVKIWYNIIKHDIVS